MCWEALIRPQHQLVPIVESTMTRQAERYQYYTHATHDNHSLNLSIVGSKNRSHLRNNKNNKPITAKKLARMALAENESFVLQQYLQQRKWLPRPQCDSEQSRKVVMKSLEMVLCQWASSLQAIRPTSQSKWQRPRGEKKVSFLKQLTRSECRRAYS